MRRALIETISRSEKRKEVLMTLQNGPVDMSKILKTLDVSRNALLPQMKILEEGYLIEKDEHKDAYLLTKFGKLIVNHLQPLLSTLEVLEDKKDYWTKHDTDCIPPELFNRLNELDTSKLVEPELCEALDLSMEAIDKCLKSKWICGFSSFYHADYPSLFMKYAENGIDFKCIFTKNVLTKFISEDKQRLQELMQYPNVSFYIYPDKLNLSSLLVSQDLILLRLLTTSGVYDPRHIMAHHQKASGWGKELFQYFLNMSTILDTLNTVPTVVQGRTGGDASTLK